MTFLRHKKPAPPTPPVDEPLKVKRIVEKQKPKPKPKPLTPSVPIIPPDVQAALSRIETKLDDLIKKDAEVHKKIENVDELSDDEKDELSEYEKTVREAQRISKEQNCVQHVNRVSDGVYKIEDFFDEDRTEISFENGKEL